MMVARAMVAQGCERFKFCSRDLKERTATVVKGELRGGGKVNLAVKAEGESRAPRFENVLLQPHKYILLDRENRM